VFSSYWESLPRNRDSSKNGLVNVQGKKDGEKARVVGAAATLGYLLVLLRFTWEAPREDRRYADNRRFAQVVLGGAAGPTRNRSAGSSSAAMHAGTTTDTAGGRNSLMRELGTA